MTVLMCTRIVGANADKVQLVQSFRFNSGQTIIQRIDLVLLGADPFALSKEFHDAQARWYVTEQTV